MVELECGLKELKDAARADHLTTRHLPRLMGWTGADLTAGKALEASLVGAVENKRSSHLVLIDFLGSLLSGWKI